MVEPGGITPATSNAIKARRRPKNRVLPAKKYSPAPLLRFPFSSYIVLSLLAWIASTAPNAARTAPRGTARLAVSSAVAVAILENEQSRRPTSLVTSYLH